MTSMTKTSRTSRAGWDDFDKATANPVPGNVLAALDELGITVTRVTDDEAFARCPGHHLTVGREDRSPSWSVNLDTGSHFCFSCGFGSGDSGGFVHVVMAALDCTRPEAVSWIRKRGGIERVRALLERKKGINALDIVNTATQINEASLALFTDPPEAALRERNLSLRSASRYGVLWDPKQGSWIIPIRDPETGQLRGWQEKNKRFFNNYPKRVDKKTTLFGYDVFEQGSPAILVESPLDVLRLHTAGVRGGLSSYGVRVSTEQMRLIRRATDTVIFALDNDRDGRLRSMELKKQWMGKIPHKRFLNYEGTTAKDIGEMSDEQIKRAVNTARVTIGVRSL